MTDDLFKAHLPDDAAPDMHLFIFPHLREFLAVDLRGGRPTVTTLNTEEVLGREFYHGVEVEFSHALRAGTPFPFDHLINLPLHLEEIIRMVAMSVILESLDIDPEDEENLPAVAVFIVSGAVISMHFEELVQNFRNLIGASSTYPTATEWVGVFSRLVSQEKTAVEGLNHQELAEAMSGDSPDYFSLWESRN